MTTLHDQRDGQVSLALAEALLRALPHSHAARLWEIVCDQRPISPQDMQAIPALHSLCMAGHEGARGPRLSPGILAVLKTAFDQHAGLVAADPLRPISTETLFLAITKGAETAALLARDIPDVEVAEDLKTGLFKTVQALKSGDLARADAIFTVLSETFDVPRLEDCGADHDPELACVLFMKAVYADEEISERATERLFDVLSGLPRDACLLRAILYNVALDVFLRQRRVSEAEEAAHRALHHYHAASERGVAFYVHLYLSVIGLWRGNIPMAEDRLKDARQSLAEFEGAVPNDTLLLRSFEMIVAYEQGHSDALIKHLMGGEDTIPFGELWPSVAGPIISYGRRALASRVTPAAALSWVRRWRVRQRRSLRFDKLISVQEALALQELGRWQEADEVLGALAGGAKAKAPDTGTVSSVGADVWAEAQIARFASGLDRNAKSTELARQIQNHLEDPNLSVRQRLMLRLEASQSALARGVEREAARHLSAAIQEADPDELPAIWAEQRQRVADILGQRDLRAELRRFPRLQRQVQVLAKVEAVQKPKALTRQEFRVLQLLAEAQSNKAIGLRLGIALPTVKFHVANLCRKTGAVNRRGVVRAAVDLGWLSDG